MAEKEAGVSFHRSGPGLKEKLGMADTGSVVNSVKGTVSYGRIAGQKDFDGRRPQSISRGSRRSTCAGYARRRW